MPTSELYRDSLMNNSASQIAERLQRLSSYILPLAGIAESKVLEPRQTFQLYAEQDVEITCAGAQFSMDTCPDRDLFAFIDEDLKDTVEWSV
jgi:hypothetical protein